MSDYVEDEDDAPFPFSMVEKMMPMYPMIAVLGWMIVLIAFLVGLFSFSSAIETFLSDSKAIRESSPGKFTDANTSIHVIQAWLPPFKFLGLGFGLLSITMALGTIAKRLRTMGLVVSGHIDEKVRPIMPEQPKRVRVFQMSAMMGIMILMITFVLGLWIAFGPVNSYFDGNTIQTLNGYTGSNLKDLGFVASYKDWLTPLKFIGMASLFVAITIALTVIIDILKWQAELLDDFTKNN